MYFALIYSDKAEIVLIKVLVKFSYRPGTTRPSILLVKLIRDRKLFDKKFSIFLPSNFSKTYKIF